MSNEKESKPTEVEMIKEMIGPNLVYNLMLFTLSSAELEKEHRKFKSNEVMLEENLAKVDAAITKLRNNPKYFQKKEN